MNAPPNIPINRFAHGIQHHSQGPQQEAFTAAWLASRRCVEANVFLPWASHGILVGNPQAKSSPK